MIWRVFPQRFENMILLVAETCDIENVITADRELIMIGIFMGVRNYANVPVLFHIYKIPTRLRLV